jgi:hypothetical protein
MSSILKLEQQQKQNKHYNSDFTKNTDHRYLFLDWKLDVWLTGFSLKYFAISLMHTKNYEIKFKVCDYWF